VIKKFSIGFATIALAFASQANSYKVTLLEPSVINGTELKPGDYKVEIKNDKAVIWQGKNSTEAPVKVEEGTSKYSATTVRYGANARVQEIRVGGTKARLVFEETQPTSKPAGGGLQ
jgi:hypothetical protein